MKFTDYIDYIVPALTGGIGWLASSKLRKAKEKTAMADATSAELENLSAVRAAEKQLISDMRTHLTELTEINNELKAIIDKKDQVIAEYKRVISRQEKDLAKCKQNCKI